MYLLLLLYNKSLMYNISFNPHVSPLSKLRSLRCFSFLGHMVSVISTQLCHCSTKAGKENTEMNELDCVPM